MNGGSVVSIKIHLQIGDDLRRVHNDQLVYSNRQVIALTLHTGFKTELAHNCQTKVDYLNITMVTVLLLYNACTYLINMMEICVINNNNFKIHPIFLKKQKTLAGKFCHFNFTTQIPALKFCFWNSIAQISTHKFYHFNFTAYISIGTQVLPS